MVGKPNGGEFGASPGRRVRAGSYVPAQGLGFDPTAFVGCSYDSVILSAEQMLWKVHEVAFQKSLNDFSIISPFSNNLKSV